MKVVLISVHDAESDRKTGFHFWAETLGKRGDEALFVTVSSSMLSLLKKNGKQLIEPFNRWVEVGAGFKKFTWMPVFHPLYLGNAVLHALSWPLFMIYPYLMPRRLLAPMLEADAYIIENGAGQMLVPRLARLNPKALFVFNYSDRLSVVKFHPIITHSLKAMLPHIDMIRLNAAAMAEDFPKDAKMYYIPQAINKAPFDAPMDNPYKTPKNVISVGDMIFDARAIEVMAKNFPDWTFHVFGKEAKLPHKMNNVIEYGEVAFSKLVPYMKFADIGLSPYKNTAEAAYLGQSSLKNVQYTYCRLPIVAPEIASGSRPHILSYSDSADEQSVVEAFARAIDYDRSNIDVSVVNGWDEVLDGMIAMASANKKGRKA